MAGNLMLQKVHSLANEGDAELHYIPLKARNVSGASLFHTQQIFSEHQLSYLRWILVRITYLGITTNTCSENVGNLITGMQGFLGSSLRGSDDKIRSACSSFVGLGPDIALQ